MSAGLGTLVIVIGLPVLAAATFVCGVTAGNGGLLLSADQAGAQA